MTALAERHTPSGWADMPGWAIVADLTPPELSAARSLHSLRRILAIVLLAIVLLCGGAYFLAAGAYSSVQDGLDNASSQTNQLTAVQGKYGAVTQLRNTTAGINGQLSTLLKTDVNTSALYDRIVRALPSGVTLTSANMSFTSTQSGVAPATPTGGATTGAAGTVTLTGSSRRIVDLASFVTSLNKMRGIVNVIPTNNSRGGNSTSGTSWTVTLQLTDAAYSHHYKASGGAATAGGSR